MRMRVDICIKCITEKRGFNARDRELLEHGQIVCPYYKGRDPINSPPEKCPWKLEHLIDSQTPNHDEYVYPAFEANESGIFVPSYT